MGYVSHRARSGAKGFATIVIVAMAGLSALLPDAARGEADKPIIAHLFADAGAYDGRSVTVYGLVIETAKAGGEFMLQDVSQMPLRVIRANGASQVGDQIIVKGVFVANGGAPYFEAREITQTKVLGGGGCC